MARQPAIGTARDRYAPRRRYVCGMSLRLRQRRCIVPQPLSAPQAWTMLLALVSGFALSQAFRTITAIMATGLQASLACRPRRWAVFAGHLRVRLRHHAVVRGIAIDWGIRRTCWWRFRWRLQGAALSAVATGYRHVAAGAGADWGGLCARFSGARCSSPATLRRRASPPCQAQPWGRWAGHAVAHRHAAGVAGG